MEHVRRLIQKFVPKEKNFFSYTKMVSGLKIVKCLVLGGGLNGHWDHPEQSNGNSSIIRQSQSNNPGLINYGNMLYPACTGQGLTRELYQQPTNTVSSDAISQYCGHTWPTGAGSCPCQTHNSLCNNPLCHKHAGNCQRPQGLSKAVECPGEGYRS